MPSAAEVNANAEASEHYHRRQRLSIGRQPKDASRPAHLVKLKNNTVSNRSRGDCLALSALETTGLDHERFWFTGASPTIRDQQFGILKRAIPAGQFGDAIVSGICFARVFMHNADHNYARCISGNVTLQSDDMGPAKIVYKPSGTGLKDCIVLLTDMPPPVYGSLTIITGSYVATSAINGLALANDDYSNIALASGTTITVSYGGQFLVNLFALCAASSTIQLRKNGVTQLGSVGTQVAMTRVIPLDDDDELTVFNNTGSSVSISNASMSLVRIAPSQFDD